MQLIQLNHAEIKAVYLINVGSITIYQYHTHFSPRVNIKTDLIVNWIPVVI